MCRTRSSPTGPSGGADRGHDPDDHESPRRGGANQNPCPPDRVDRDGANRSRTSRNRTNSTNSTNRDRSTQQDRTTNDRRPGTGGTSRPTRRGRRDLFTPWGLQATMDAATQRALAGIPAATPESPAGAAVRAYLAEQSRAFLTQSAAAARLRAACRRTSSALSACRALVDPAWADDLGDEVDRTADALAGERDTDAVRDRLLSPLDRWISEGRYPDGGAARTRTLLTRMLDRDRSAAHSSATAALVGPQFHALADKMATLAREVPLTPIADRSCAEVLPAVVTAA